MITPISVRETLDHIRERVFVIPRPSGPASARNGVARNRAFGGKRASRFAPAKQASCSVDIPAAPMFQCYFSANAVVARPRGGARAVNELPQAALRTIEKDGDRITGKFLKRPAEPYVPVPALGP